MRIFTFWICICTVSAIISYCMILPVRRQVKALKRLVEMLIRKKRE